MPLLPVQSVDNLTELVDGLKIQLSDSPKLNFWSREQLRTAISKKMKKPDDFYPIVATERLLWDACSTWKGTIRTTETLQSFLKRSTDNWYFSKIGKWCSEQLREVSVSGDYNYESVSTYLWNLTVPETISRRIFEPFLVRQSTGDCLNLVEMLWLLFALNGFDEKQSFEYWFRILDVDSKGVLSFRELQPFYSDVGTFFPMWDSDPIPFEERIGKFTDILDSDVWSLTTFKKRHRVAGRVIVSFIHARRYLETDGKDKWSGGGERTEWQKMLDKHYTRN